MIDNPTPEQLRMLWDSCTTWIREAKPTTSESIYQIDSIKESLFDLGERVCEVIGFYPEEEEEDL